MQTRTCWEEASCGTLAVYDRSRNRVGTIYLEQMPEREQPTMTRRLTQVIQGVLRGVGDHVPTLRCVNDAGCHPGGSERANAWAEQQRHTLRHETSAVAKVIASAAQQKRRHGLQGTKKDFHAALNYFKKYRQHMDFAERKKRGDPIGSGVTEAGCKVIFNQRLKQSGMRWHRQTGQYIVDLRTAQRSGIWRRIWERIIVSKTHLPPLTQTMNQNQPQTT